MKKTLILVMAIFLLIATCTSAEEKDPIIGCWYVCIDADDPIAAQMAEQGYEYGIILLCFTDDGKIINGEIDFTNKGGEVAQPSIVGKWEKTKDGYETSIVAAGVDKAFFEEDLLYVSLNKVQYHGFRKMTPIDMYYNIYRK